MKVRSMLAVVLALAGAGVPAWADIYVWRDSAGVSHYTNDLANVPPEYRQSAMTVAKDWVRAEPPPEPQPPQPAPTSPPAPIAVDEGRVHEVYDAGYAAGLHASEAAAPGAVASSSTGPVIQNLQIVPPEPRHDHLIPFVGAVAVGRRRPTASREEERDRGLPPARPAPFLQGPAGPPPVSFRQE